MADYASDGWATIFKMGGGGVKLPEELTKKWWDKKKQLLAKTHATGVGAALDDLKKDFDKVEWFWLSARPSAMKNDVENGKKFITSSAVTTLHNQLKTVRDLAKAEALVMKKNPLLKSTTSALNEIAEAADVLFVSTNPGSLSGFLGSAIKDWDLQIKAKFLANAKPNLEASKKVVNKIPASINAIKKALTEYVAEKDEEAKKKGRTDVGDKVRDLCRDMTQPLGNLHKNFAAGTPFVDFDDGAIVKLANELKPIADSQSGSQVVDDLEPKEVAQLVVDVDLWSKRFTNLVKDVTI